VLARLLAAGSEVDATEVGDTGDGSAIVVRDPVGQRWALLPRREPALPAARR
jgi:hypothetical protein